MLNKDGQRELAYVVIIEEIQEIPGYDRVEHARTSGWWCIVPKGQFKVGDPAIYFEIDSKVPADNPTFAFLQKRNYKIKSIKMCKVLSQGLLMHPSDFGWEIQVDGSIWIPGDGLNLLIVKPFGFHSNDRIRLVIVVILNFLIVVDKSVNFDER